MPPVYGPTNPSPESQAAAGVRRFASFVELKPEHEAVYREMHADVWPEVVAACKRANIQNYHIWVQTIGDRKFIFRSFEYTGVDPAADFAAVGEDPTIREKWWPITDDCMTAVDGGSGGDVWRDAELVMFLP
ncbi:L-rhamnose mutarotase [Botrimarina colliarenosi]|uniref:L-rhamnose mutarotase n=1 Tax=Botrimarina colliarenosi TaxID=2528001 RepID=A0A5C6ALS6_9BACT|nr:L-rhamnose mutarotase [Botrimarina colliarenosi]TWU00219.1 L-rhamnose mutarotase [Botrimarina colliarenosi]